MRCPGQGEDLVRLGLGEASDAFTDPDLELLNGKVGAAGVSRERNVWDSVEAALKQLGPNFQKALDAAREEWSVKTRHERSGGAR